MTGAVLFTPSRRTLEVSAPMPSNPICSLPDCNRPRKVGYYCNQCYRAVRGQYAARTTVERFWEKVTKTETCWLWTGGHTRESYPQFWDGKRVLAHRWAYQQFVGPIPPGLHLDHVRERGCTSTLCVRLSHLEPVTPRENTMRSNGITAINARKTHCAHGHKYTPETLHMSRTGHRQCRACWKMRREASKR